MRHRKPVLAALTALVLTLGGVLAAVASTGAQAATSTLCQEQTASVAGGTYIVQNNEYDSSASECVTTDGNADFTVANSGIDNGTDGSPGAYPSIYQGCHWGECSSGGLTSTPVEVSGLTTGKVTTSWSTTQPGGSANTYDVAYDIWFNKTATTDTQPDCTELMVWLNHNGSVQPFGSQVDSNVTVGGTSYNVWEGAQSSWNTITYDMTAGVTSVSNLDIGSLAQNAVSLGYLSSSCYLIDVEAGFELWQGGAGLTTNAFSVSTNGTGPSPSPSPTPSSSPSPSPSPSPSRSPSPSPSPSPTTTSKPGVCSATYSVVSSWSGGLQGQVVVTNTGSGTLNGWSLGWTFPGSQDINNLWNGSYTQSGETIAVSNASYDGTLAPGATATVGFTATGSGASPSSVSCT